MLDHFCQETMAVLGTRIRKRLTFCARPAELGTERAREPPSNFDLDTSHYAYVAMSTESYGARING